MRFEILGHPVHKRLFSNSGGAKMLDIYTRTYKLVLEIVSLFMRPFCCFCCTALSIFPNLSGIWVHEMNE